MSSEGFTSPIRVESSTVDGVCSIKVSGEVDAHSCEEMRAALVAAFADGQRTIAVDLADVSFIDSSGLRVLISAYKNAEEAGGSLVVVAPSEPVVRLLEITGQLERFVPVAE